MGTLLDLASLVMIPSGVKEDKLYSVKPTDGSGDFTFSRNSDIQATRVNSSGLIEKAKVNLLTYSNTFSNAAWSTANSTITSGQSGYDGSSDAWLLTDDTTNGSHDVRKSSLTFTGLNSVSVYAKAGTLNFLKVFTGISTTYFNLGTGEVGTNGHAGASIEAVGATGWYRCSLFDSGSFTFALIGTTNADNVSSYAGTGSGTIFIQDAQLNHGLIAQDYVETTTTAVVEGLTADLPRLDYSGGASCPSLLLEGSRTNLVADSEYFNGSNWDRGSIRGVINDNDTTSPEGVLNASSYIPNSVFGRHYIAESTFTATSGIDYTFSFFAKANGYNFVQIALSTGFDITYQNFNLSTGALGNGDLSVGYEARIEPFEDGWYRISVTAETNTTSSYFLIVPISTDVATRLPEYSGDSVNGIYIYGIQREEGSYPTSYIPTYGASAQRNKDSAITLSVPDLIGQTEGTWFVEYTRNSLVESSYMVLSNIAGTTAGSYQNGIYLFHLNNLGANFVSDGFVSNVIQFGFVKSGGLSLGKHKIAIAYAQNDVALYIDGVQIGTDTSANIPAMNFLTIGGGADVTGHRQSVNQALLFKTRLSNTELAALTTI